MQKFKLVLVGKVEVKVSDRDIPVGETLSLSFSPFCLELSLLCSHFH